MESSTSTRWSWERTGACWNCLGIWIFPNKSTKRKASSTWRSSWHPKQHNDQGREGVGSFREVVVLREREVDTKMAAVAFALPILPGQENLVRSMGEEVSGRGEL